MIILVELFFAFFKIGLFTIGGGIASLPLIETIIVNEKAWLTVDEFSHLVIISEMTPGPVGINASTFVGNKVAGLLGGVIATIGNVLPALIIVILLAKLYFKYKNLRVVNSVLNGLRPTIVGLIMAAAFGILLVALFGSKNINIFSVEIDYIKIVLLAVYLAILKQFKINPILIIIISGFMGYIFL